MINKIKYLKEFYKDGCNALQLMRDCMRRFLGDVAKRPLAALMLVLVGLTLHANAYAASQTYMQAACVSLGGPGANWASPESAESSNNVYASASVDGTVTDPLQCTNYGFDIPATATIVGIEVRVERKASNTNNGGSRDNSLNLVKAGTAVGANRATGTTYTTTDTVETHGSPTDLWGTTWTPADINNANFGAVFTATKPSAAGGAHTVTVDQIQITVYYDTSSQTQSQVNCSSLGGAGANWTTPELAESSNNAYASVSVDGTVSDPLQCVNYGFNIPSGAVIDGIEVRVERKSNSTNNGGSRDNSLNLVKAGTAVGANRATGTTYTTTDTVEIHGSPTDLWGTTWTPADINNANFGAVFTATKPSAAGGAHTVTVDQIQITVYYTRPPPVLVSANLACGTTNQVEVFFSLPVTPATAQNTANYALSGGATISSAVLGVDGQTVTLTTSTLPAQSFTLTVNNVMSTAGGVIAANSQTTFFAEIGYLPGLRGTYFDQMNLTGNAFLRIDGPVDFDWAAGTPGVAGIGANNFSVRWQGFVTAPVTGNYTFRTRSDDGVRLYVDGNLVINNWTDHSATNDDSAAIALTAGQRYPVIMEFYENGGDAVAQLSWSGPSTGGFQFIPQSALSYCGGTLPVPRAYYKLDEATWSAAGDVADSSGNGLNGTAQGGATPVPAQVCNGAQLDGSSRYIQINGLSNELNATASLAFWIRTTQTGNDTAWQAPGVTGVEQSGGGDDIFWGFLDSTGHIGVQKGDGTSVKSAAAINNGLWRHVVLTRDSTTGAARIYVDGALSASGTVDTGVVGTAFASLGRVEVSGAGTIRYLNGQLDEVRIYNQVLTDSEVIAIRDITRPCAIAFSHVRIEHNGTGLTCEPATVTVKACADASCSTQYTGSVTTTLSPTGWLGGDTISFSGGMTTAQLRKTTAGAVVLGAGTTSPAPSSATLCFNGGIETCSLDFQSTGFAFSAVPTQTAGTVSGSQTLRAIRADPVTGVCTGLFNGDVNVELAFQCVNPAACQTGQQVTINNNGSTAIAANPGSGVSTWTAKSMTFGADSTANFTLNYPDVGSLRLSARHNINGSGDYMAGVSNNFVVKPAGFTVTGIRRTADNGANPGAADAGGAAFIKAGESMTLTATAVNAQGNPTPNFGKETTAEGVRLTTALATGLGLTSNPVLGNGTIAGGLFSNGAATVTNVTWGEVGIITITPGVGDGDYLGVGDVTGTTSGNVGRFTPHHFDVSANTPLFATACTAGAFTYVGQRFNYASGMEPVLTVTARNLAGGTTQNYKGTTPASEAFFKITTGSLTGKAYSAASGTLDASTVTAPDPAIVANGDGTGTLTFNSGTGILFVRSTPVAPFNAEISLAINVIDTDSVAYSTNPARFGQASAGNGIAFSTGKAMRFGRLRLTGASGSQQLPLKVPFETQFWTGTFFATNTLDTCTTVGTGNVGLGNYIGNLNAGETTVTAVSALSAGRGTISLSAPGAGNNGSVDLAVNLGTGAAAAACPAFAPAATAGSLAHLRGQWCGAAHDKDPSSRARFGIRAGTDQRIYMRENY